MTYYLIIYPGPVKHIVDRETYESATNQANDMITTRHGRYKILNRYVFSVEELNAAFVVITNSEKQPLRGRDFLIKKS